MFLPPFLKIKSDQPVPKIPKGHSNPVLNIGFLERGSSTAFQNMELYPVALQGQSPIGSIIAHELCKFNHFPTFIFLLFGHKSEYSRQDHTACRIYFLVVIGFHKHA